MCKLVSTFILQIQPSLFVFLVVILVFEFSKRTSSIYCILNIKVFTVCGTSVSPTSLFPVFVLKVAPHRIPHWGKKICINVKLFKNNYGVVLNFD